VSDYSYLQNVLGKYFTQIVLTTDGDRMAGSLSDTFCAAISHDSDIYIEYDMNSYELKIQAR
jgi:hypothetical protein